MVLAKETKEETQKLNYKKGIKKSDARKIAKLHLNSVVKQGSDCGDWTNSTKIVRELPLYDMVDTLCAYAFELGNKKEDAGYIVVGINEEYTPIIEYSTTGRFLKDTLSEQEYLVYDGTLDYYKTTKNSEKMSNIHKKESKDKQAVSGERTKHCSEWKSMEQEVCLYSSNPPEYGVEITKPDIYESGYSKVSWNYVPSYHAVHYFTTNSFPALNKFGCLPTATTNLLYYWHERRFYNLMNSSWENTFSLIYDYLGINSQGGGYISRVPDALDRYLFSMGVETGVTHHWSAAETTWERMKKRIDDGEPFIYSIKEHAFYQGSHAVLALGYRNYKYSDGSNSSYLCIADGWIDLPDRYVHTEAGSLSEYNEMATLYFVGK